jgi:hypothetical protein
MRDVEAALERIRGSWLAGRPALEHCPAAWRAATAAGDGEVALIALAAHATAVLFRPAPPPALAPRPLLPALALPTLRDGARARLRRILATRKGGSSLHRQLIDLAAARGFAVHPADWMPAPDDDWLPDVYAPWLDWVRGEHRAKPDADITLETYDEWPWSERRAALTRLRARDPAAARAIIAAKAPAEPVDRRIRLIEILGGNLSLDDAAFLESLARDHSQRVQRLAASQLARLARGSEAEALATELAALLEIRKTGALRRRRQLAFPPLKTAREQDRRRVLLGVVGFAGLVRALDVSEEQALETMPAASANDLTALVEMVASTGSDDARRRLLGLILDDGEAALELAQPLGRHLSTAERHTLLPRILQRDSDGFATTVALMGRDLGATPLAALLGTPGFKDLMRMAKAAAGGAEEAQAADSAQLLEAMLAHVALLADATAAAELVARFTALGLSPVDPKLEPLRFNAALHQETTP